MSETGTGVGNGTEPRRPCASEAALLDDLKPVSALEHMMVRQMARAHDTTMACFDRAEQATEPAAREVELRLAARFMGLFLQQAGTLERRRTQASQAAMAGTTAAFETAPAAPVAIAPLSRQQRRARERQQRKAQRRLAGAA